MKEKLKLKKETKRILKNVIITLLVVIIDVIIYHYLTVYGELQGTSSWCNAFLVTGWAWLVMGTLPFMIIIWE